MVWIGLVGWSWLGSLSVCDLCSLIAVKDLQATSPSHSGKRYSGTVSIEIRGDR